MYKNKSQEQKKNFLRIKWLIIALLFIFFVVIFLGYGFFYSKALNNFKDTKHQYEEGCELSHLLEMDCDEYSKETSLSVFKLKEEEEDLNKKIGLLSEENERIYNQKVDAYHSVIEDYKKHHPLSENLEFDNEFDISKHSKEEYENLKVEKSLVEKLILDIETISSEKEKILLSISGFEATKLEKGEYVNPLWDKTDEDLELMVDEMTIEEKVGQMLMYGFSGTTLNQTTKNDITNLDLGGVILMGGNVSSESQVSKLTSGIQEINEDIPLLISIDQEGGAVKRVTWDKTAGQGNWGKLSDDELCDIGTERSKLLHSMGINLNFSPVTDL